MRHLFCYLNVKTKEPNEFKGQIGQKLESCANVPVVVFLSIEKLENCANLAVVVFLSIENNLPHLENKNDLTTD